MAATMSEVISSPVPGNDTSAPTTTSLGGAENDVELTPDLDANSEDVAPSGENDSAGGVAPPGDDSQHESSPVSEGSQDGVESSGPLDAAAVKAAVKAKKKEDKSIDHLLKALASLQTPEEKLAALCKKYTDLLEEHRVLQTKFKQTTRKLTSVTREKEQLQSEHSKAILAKSKLESLCRELQRHNKLVKEESLARAREEEEKRKEVTNKFQSTINDIQQQMSEHHTKNASLREENIELANKLKNLIEQYELREQHMEKVFKHKELEQQLVDAKLAQANLIMTEEKEKSLKEKQLLLTEATEAHKKIDIMETQEKQLRAQVALYTEKYEDFQSTLAKSNEVFGSFKTEMDKMTKKIKKLEKETNMWRQRWENSNRALLEMAEEKTRHDKESTVLQNKIQKLESLCRALQKERTKGTTSDKEDSVDRELKEATKTPPNTPNDSSRASPETVSPQTGEGSSDPLPDSTSETPDSQPSSSNEPANLKPDPVDPILSTSIESSDPQLGDIESVREGEHDVGAGKTGDNREVLSEVTDTSDQGHIVSGVVDTGELGVDTGKDGELGAGVGKDGELGADVGKDGKLGADIDKELGKDGECQKVSGE